VFLTSVCLFVPPFCCELSKVLVLFSQGRNSRSSLQTLSEGGRKGEEKTRNGVQKVFMPLVLECAIYPLTCMAYLVAFKILEQIPCSCCAEAVCSVKIQKWDALSLLFSCNRFQVIAKIQTVKAFCPVKPCALMISMSQDCPGLITMVELIARQWD